MILQPLTMTPRQGGKWADQTSSHELEAELLKRSAKAKKSNSLLLSLSLSHYRINAASSYNTVLKVTVDRKSNNDIHG